MNPYGKALWRVKLFAEEDIYADLRAFNARIVSFIEVICRFSKPFDHYWVNNINRILQ